MSMYDALWQIIDIIQVWPNHMQIIGLCLFFSNVPEYSFKKSVITHGFIDLKIQ